MKFLQTTIAFLATLGALAAADNPVVRSIADDLPYDENGKVAAHQVLYPAGNPNCPAAQKVAPHGFDFRPVSGEALQAVFPGRKEGDCAATCVERGADRSVAHAVMPHRHYDLASSLDFDNWFERTCRNVEVCLLNYHSKDTPIKIFWVPSDGEKVELLAIDYGEQKTRCFSSYIGHTLQAEDGATGEVLETFEVEFITTRSIGTAPRSADPKVIDNLEAEVKTTLDKEWSKHAAIQRTFSPLGFKKARLPEDVFHSMGAFYYNNRHFKVSEEWTGKGLFVNWWETDPAFIQIPWDVKALWQDRLRELVEAWAGVAVEQTDMYGLRQYQEGARLLTHVDRESTHAVSLIVNIAQGNMTEPWPVEVNDHGDRLHEVLMEPGDIVYYESAKALHGRNRPLSGSNAYYVNLFTHYRPIGDPEWMRKPNPEGVPEPVVEMKGECRLERVATTAGPNNQLGIVEAVKCDDERLGPYVSPSLFTAHNGDDLMEWWKRTGDKDRRISME